MLNIKKKKGKKINPFIFISVFIYLFTYKYKKKRKKCGALY